MRLEYRRIKVEELEDYEKSQLLSECAASVFEVQLHEIIEHLEKNEMAAYRWTGPFTGLMVVRVYKHTAGQEMFLWHLSGRGFLENIKAVQSMTKRLARELDCRWITAEARNKALAAIYGKLARPVAVSFLMEA